jgi:hypothetical protein
MALNISAWSIRRPLPAVVLSIILLLLGWSSFMRLPVTRLPTADIPVISVIVSQFGAGPSELESQVTKYIEDSVSGVEGVRHIASQIIDGVSVTTTAIAPKQGSSAAPVVTGADGGVAGAHLDASLASAFRTSDWARTAPGRFTTECRSFWIAQTS